jgi:hypothetical protein
MASMNNMRLQGDTLRSEIKQVLEILKKWDEALEDPGIPGDDIPANAENIEVFRYQLYGELMLASSRLSSIADVLES